jgi:hypothetical protein
MVIVIVRLRLVGRCTAKPLADETIGVEGQLGF